MRIYPWVFCLALALSAGGAETHFDFDGPAGTVPTNFVPLLAGQGQPGAWKILMEEMPTLGQPTNLPASVLRRHAVLAQTSQDPTDEHFPMLLYTGGKFRDFKFSTRFKIVSGVAEQMAGMVFRYLDSSNYYVIRASALGRNVRFYKVVEGIRSDPIGPNLDVTTNSWHTLGVQCEGTQISVYYDDRRVMPPLGDHSFNEGLIGFRTKSDAVVYYSDAMVDYKPLIPAAQAIVNSVVAKQSRLLGLRVYTLQADNTNATHVIASKDPAEIGKEGTDAELKAIQSGAVSFGRETGAVLVTLPLHDRNGEFIAAVRVRLRTFLGETQDNAITRARTILKLMQDQVAGDRDLE